MTFQIYPNNSCLKVMSGHEPNSLDVLFKAINDDHADTSDFWTTYSPSYSPCTGYTQKILRPYIENNGYQKTLEFIISINSRYSWENTYFNRPTNNEQEFDSNKKGHLLFSFISIGCTDFIMPKEPSKQNMTIFDHPFTQALKNVLPNISQDDLDDISLPALNLLIIRILHRICLIHREINEIPNWDFQKQAIDYFFSWFSKDGFWTPSKLTLLIRFVEYYQEHKIYYENIKASIPEFLQNQICPKQHTHSQFPNYV